MTVQREMDRLERWMIFLASVGATAPFIGLFGTVWGIMHSLRGDRRDAQHQPRRGRARHRRGAVRHRDRPGRGDPGGAGLQQDQQRPRPLRVRLEGFGAEFSAILSRQSEERCAEPWRSRGNGRS